MVMRLFTKRETSETVAVPKRVQNLDRPSLLQWFDTSIMNLGASFDQWRFHGGPANEVDNALNALTVVWQELQTRVDGNNPR